MSSTNEAEKKKVQVTAEKMSLINLTTTVYYRAVTLIIDTY